MSGRKRSSYRLVGGPEDGAIYDDISDDEMEDLRTSRKATGLELVPYQPSSVSDELDAVDEQPDPGVERDQRPRHDVTVGEAVVAEPEAPAPAMPAWQPPTRTRAPQTAARPVTDDYEKGGGWRESALDALMAFSSGATAGGADDFLDLLDPTAGQLYRDEMKIARERSPYLFHGVEAVAGAPAAMAGGVGWNMGLGALQGALGSEGDAYERAHGAMRGALTAGALHGAATGVEKLGSVAKGVSGGLRTTANAARNSAIGQPDDFRSLRSDRGMEYARSGVPDAAKELGITNRIIPQSPAGYEGKAGKIVKEEGPVIDSSLQEAGQNLETHVRRDDVQHALRQKAAIARDGTTRGEALANSYEQMAILLETGQPPMMTPRQLNELKTAYDKQGFKEGKGSDLPSSISAETARGGRDSANELLLDALNLTPGPKAVYQTAANKYGKASMIQDMAGDLAASNQGQKPQGGFVDTLTAPLTRTVRSYGPDASANLAELGANLTGNVGTALQGKVPGVDASLPKIGASLASGRAAQVAGQQSQYTPQPIYPPTLGPGLGQLALRALSNSPDVLGPYAAQIQEAANNPAPGAIDDLMIRLVQTDPQFRAQVLTRL